MCGRGVSRGVPPFRRCVVCGMCRDRCMAEVCRTDVWPPFRGCVVTEAYPRWAANPAPAGATRPPHRRAATRAERTLCRAARCDTPAPPTAPRRHTHPISGTGRHTSGRPTPGAPADAPSTPEAPTACPHPWEHASAPRYPERYATKPTAVPIDMYHRTLESAPAHGLPASAHMGWRGRGSAPVRRATCRDAPHLEHAGSPAYATRGPANWSVARGGGGGGGRGPHGDPDLRPRGVSGSQPRA